MVLAPLAPAKKPVQNRFFSACRPSPRPKQKTVEKVGLPVAPTLFLDVQRCVLDKVVMLCVEGAARDFASQKVFFGVSVWLRDLYFRRRVCCAILPIHVGFH